MIASAIYDLSFILFWSIYVFVRDKTSINRTDVLKHSHISLACIHDRSARLAAGMGARLRGLLYLYCILLFAGFFNFSTLKVPEPFL